MLLERDEPLARLTALLEEAAGGRGGLVLLGGEAGVGKTALVGALVSAVQGRLAVRRGACDDVGTALALGPLIDAFPELADEIEQAEAIDRPGLFRRLRAVLSADPALLVLEDLHWADEATLEMLRFLGRRLADLPVLVIATFRDDETQAGSPLALLLGDLATAAGVGRLAVRALSPEGVGALVAAAGSPLDAAALHRRTGGNAFFVTEVLAAGGTELPATVRDAVLARTARLSGAARRVLAAAAVLGPGADLDLLVAVSGSPAGAVDECVRAGVLVPDGDGWAFRHDLARQAVEESLAPGERAALHAVALRELRDRGDRDEGRLAHHAAASGDRDAVLFHAPRAAARSSRLGAHLAAADLYRLALRHAGPSPPNRRELCAALSYECYVTNQFVEAYALCREAMELSRAAGDAVATGSHLRWLSRLAGFLGRSAEAEELAGRALATLEATDDRRELALAYANLAALRMVASQTDGAVAWGERAAEVAREIGDVAVEVNALVTVGSALAAGHDRPEDWQRLRAAVALAVEHDLQDQAGRGYLNITACGLLNRRYRELDDDFAAGLAYCDARDMDAFGNQILMGVAWSLSERGRYAEVDEVLTRARARTRVSLVNRMALGHVTGQLAARRDGVWHPLLDDSLEVAEGSGQPQLVVPMAAARAEAAWILDRRDAVLTEVERGWPFAVSMGNRSFLGELAWWSWLAGDPRCGFEATEPFRLLLEGKWSAAAAAWEELGCPLWVAYALGFSPELADARRAVAITAEIGADAARTAILRERQRRGLPVPHGPRAATRANPLRLTRRELEVLELLAAGLTNSEIAGCLFLSERTVAHHVSAVLQKLGEPSRSRAVAKAISEGVVSPERMAPQQGPRR